MARFDVLHSTLNCDATVELIKLFAFIILFTRVLGVSTEHFSRGLKHNHGVMFGKAVVQLRD
jgi:hypothetical protein